MNREILFKAKRKDNGKWVEGYYCKLDETTYCISEDYERHPVPTHHYILYETMTDWGLPNRFLQFEIDPDTLCQYTGLTDKNGKKIWENDIVKANLDESYPEDITYIKILWNECGFCVNENCSTDIWTLEKWDAEHFQVCGNIFDNPDLLEVEE